MHNNKVRETGMATILVMTLVGLAVTATTLGTIYTIRSTQDSHLAIHANIGSESLAWAGVELTRQYLATADAETLTKDSVIELTSHEEYRINSVVSAPLSGDEIVFNITGSTNITNSTPLASTTLQVVYEWASTPLQTTSLEAGLIFNGNLKYSGGGLSVLDGSNLSSAIITGDLDIANGAKAQICGCVKGNITASGGGLKVDSTCNGLQSEKKITITSMASPTNLKLNAREIEITQNGGSYSAIRAGAFSADVMSGETIIGKALIGGKRIFDENTQTYTNSIQPSNTGTALIKLSTGSILTLDLSKYAANQSNNESLKLISGSEETLPATDTLGFYFNSNNQCLDSTGTGTGTCGGDITFQSSTVTEIWGNEIKLGGNGEGGGTYSLLKGHQGVTTNGGNISVAQLFSGGNLWLKSVTDQNQTWALIRPTKESQISGKILMSNGVTPWTYSPSPVPNLQENQKNAAPGLPGIPYCDTTPKPVDIDGMQGAAHYVFYFDGNTPMLRIQGVKYSNNNNIVPSGPYDLSQNNPNLPDGVKLICNWSDKNAHCGKDASPSKGWKFEGIENFPTGVVWFEGSVTFDGLTKDSRPLINTLLATNDITLTTDAETLTAPNFSTPQNVCDGTVYPSSLCDKSSSPSRFATWDDNGTTRSGNPIGNLAIATETNLEAQGWTINGNVILGREIKTGGSKTTINGGLVVGGNAFSTTTSQQGGLEVNVSTLTADQNHIPGGESNMSGEANVRVKWIREI